MSTTSVNNLSSSYLQSILSSQLQNTGSTGTTNGIAPLAPPADQTQISPLANLLSQLQQLQQNNPAQYQQVTQQIATNLQTAAQTAQSSGNTTAANQLTQLATDFSNASANDQLPSVKDLAEASGGGHHHHHFNQDSGGGNQGTLNPLTIISNTLSAAGVTSSAQGQ
jgi:hypothetical protein